MMTYVADAARPVIDRLEAIGPATSIANYLSDEGITGYRESALFCPIARYLKRETGYEWVVGTDTARAGISVELTYAHREVTRPDVPLGPNVQQFIRLFDSGVYPDLVTDFANFASDDPPVFA